MGLVLTDNTGEVKKHINTQLTQFLHEASAELDNAIKNNCTVDTGETRGSFTYIVDEQNTRATLGSPDENAIWEEYGTGVYAQNGDGRKTPWVYEDRNGIWHTTTGKAPKRMMQKAYAQLKNPIINQLQNIMGDL